jgi:hypothetical protein
VGHLEGAGAPTEGTGEACVDRKRRDSARGRSTGFIVEKVEWMLVSQDSRTFFSVVKEGLGEANGAVWRALDPI